MRTKFVIVIGLVIVFSLVSVAAYAKTSYFGVPNKALGVPEEFEQTEAAIEKAERSPGALACAEKIAQAKKLAKKGVETYWACRDKEAMALLAKARKLAKEAELCRLLTTLTGVHFAFDSAELSPKGRAILDKDVAALKGRPDVKVEVAGYTCSIGTEGYNQGLSVRRAKSVKNYLVSKGISSNRLKVTGYGESRPAFSNDTREGRVKNRRVELNVY